MENPIQINESKRYFGTIIHINKDEGYFFIISRELKFTRIFAHWSALVPSTLHFAQLTKGMKVWFNAMRYVDPNTKVDKGIRAIKIDVEVEEHAENVGADKSRDS